MGPKVGMRSEFGHIGGRQSAMQRRLGKMLRVVGPLQLHSQDAEMKGFGG